ncbi:endonuclease/exonuclease/phosphatase family protein [Thiolapillus sp.]
MGHSRPGFRFIVRGGLLLSLLLLNACADIPERLHLLHSGDRAHACQAPGRGAIADVGLSPHVFTLTTWNICKGCRRGWKQDLRQLASRSDLLLLQEARLEPDLESLLKDLHMTWSMAHAFSLEGSPAGVLTSARITPLAACGQRIFEPYLRLPKTAMISYFSIAGHARSLLVVNIHGVNFAPGTTELVSQFKAIQETIAEHQGPVIIAGDFNTWSRKRMAALKQLAEESGLRAVEFQGQPSLHFGRRLDHVYYRGLIPLQARAMALQSSDHHPLSVTFKLDKDS